MITVTTTQEVVTVQAAATQLITVTPNVASLTLTAPGPQGIAGPQNLFVQNETPTFTGPALWVQTGLNGGNDMTLWVNV